MSKNIVGVLFGGLLAASIGCSTLSGLASDACYATLGGSKAEVACEELEKLIAENAEEATEEEVAE